MKLLLKNSRNVLLFEYRNKKTTSKLHKTDREGMILF